MPVLRLEKNGIRIFPRSEIIHADGPRVVNALVDLMITVDVH